MSSVTMLNQNIHILDYCFVKKDQQIWAWVQRCLPYENKKRLANNVRSNKRDDTAPSGNVDDKFAMTQGVA